MTLLRPFLMNSVLFGFLSSYLFLKASYLTCSLIVFVLFQKLFLGLSSCLEFYLTVLTTDYYFCNDLILFYFLSMFSLCSSNQFDSFSSYQISSIWPWILSLFYFLFCSFFAFLSLLFYFIICFFLLIPSRNFPIYQSFVLYPFEFITLCINYFIILLPQTYFKISSLLQPTLASFSRILRFVIFTHYIMTQSTNTFIYLFLIDFNYASCFSCEAISLFSGCLIALTMFDICFKCLAFMRESNFLYIIILQSVLFFGFSYFASGRKNFTIITIIKGPIIENIQKYHLIQFLIRSFCSKAECFLPLEASMDYITY